MKNTMTRIFFPTPTTTLRCCCCCAVVVIVVVSSIINSTNGFTIIHKNNHHHHHHHPTIQKVSTTTNRKIQIRSHTNDKNNRAYVSSSLLPLHAIRTNDPSTTTTTTTASTTTTPSASSSPRIMNDNNNNSNNNSLIYSYDSNSNAGSANENANYYYYKNDENDKNENDDLLQNLQQKSIETEILLKQNVLNTTQIKEIELFLEQGIADLIQEEEKLVLFMKNKNNNNNYQNPTAATTTTIQNGQQQQQEQQQQQLVDQSVEIEDHNLVNRAKAMEIVLEERLVHLTQLQKVLDQHLKTIKMIEMESILEEKLANLTAKEKLFEQRLASVLETEKIFDERQQQQQQRFLEAERLYQKQQSSATATSSSSTIVLGHTTTKNNTDTISNIATTTAPSTTKQPVKKTIVGTPRTSSFVGPDVQSSIDIISDSSARANTKTIHPTDGVIVVDDRKSKQKEEKRMKFIDTIWASSTPHLIQGNSLRTWSFESPAVERAFVLLKTDGRQLDAKVELWHGPDNIPQRMKVYIEDGSTHSVGMFINTPKGQNTIAVKNIGPIVFPLYASVGSDTINDGGAGKACLDATRSIRGHIVQGGAVETYPFNYTIDSVAVTIKTAGRPLNATIEVLQGPNNNKQVIDLYTEDGLYRPIIAVLNTPGNSKVIRIVNNAPVEFPLHSSVVPFEYMDLNDLDDDDDLQIIGDW